MLITPEKATPSKTRSHTATNTNQVGLNQTTMEKHTVSNYRLATGTLAKRSPHGRFSRVITGITVINIVNGVGSE